MRVKLRDEVQKKVTVKKTVKEPLYATKCIGCGRVFEMFPFCNDENLGELIGTFNGQAVNDQGKSLGNQFSASVCSFQCADIVFSGKWRQMEKYRHQAEQNLKLVRGELKITTYTKTEKDLIKDWEANSGEEEL